MSWRLATERNCNRTGITEGRRNGNTELKVPKKTSSEAETKGSYEAEIVAGGDFSRRA